MIALLRGGAEASLNVYVEGINQVKVKLYYSYKIIILNTIGIILKIENILYRYIFSIL